MFFEPKHKIRSVLLGESSFKRGEGGAEKGKREKGGKGNRGRKVTEKGYRKIKFLKY